MFYDGTTYLDQPRAPITWIIKHILPAGGFCNIYGKPKAGKSFLALGQAVAISTGARHWMGLPVLTHGPVAYFQIDTPRSLWIERLEQARDNGHDVSKIHFADIDSGTPYPFNILTDGPWLKNQLDRIKPVAIFIDTLRELHAGDENDSGVMKMVVAATQSACAPAGMALISHAKKEGQIHHDDLMSDNRGSSYVAGRMDSVISVRTEKGNDNKGTMDYQGRTAGLATIKMVRTDEDGIWVPDGTEHKMLGDIATVLAMFPAASDREKAKALAEIWGVDLETARKRLARRKDIFKPRLAA
jgi:RecA-family ATPase